MKELRALALAALWLLLSGSAHADTYLLVVTGLAGEESYQETFSDWAGHLLDYAEDSGLATDRMQHLSAGAIANASYKTGMADREGITQALTDLAGRVGPEDQLWLVFFGHGSVQGKRALFNIAGPDIDSVQFNTLLDPIQAGKLIIVNTTATSGAFVQDLAGSNRIVISATRSGSERYFSYFGGYWVAAFDIAQGGDLDKDGRISLLESFRYAKREVERRYQEEKRLQTEHALLDDNGDGRGSADPQAHDTEDGALAARTYLLDLRDIAGQDPARAALLARQQTIEQTVQDWIARKSALEADAYYQQLENLLVDLTQVDRALRAYE